jgi:hypothetical protein
MSVQRLATGLTARGSNPGGSQIFRTCPNWPWGPSTFLYNGYGVFPGGKTAGAWRWPPTPSSAEIKERVELYMYSPLGLHDLFGVTFIFTFHINYITNTCFDLCKSSSGYSTGCSAVLLLCCGVPYRGYCDTGVSSRSLCSRLSLLWAISWVTVLAARWRGVASSRSTRATRLAHLTALILRLSVLFPTMF